MAKFVQTTQRRHMQTVLGPSGERYISLQGQPFVVTNKQDIESFKKKRSLKIHSLLKKPKMEAELELNRHEQAEKLTKILLDVKGIGPKTAETVVQKWVSYSNLLSEVLQNGPIHESLSSSQVQSIREHFATLEFGPTTRKQKGEN